ncbi:MAG: glycosyltransferase [Patescibacteria group bacterium]
MKLLIITQKVSKDDPILGFFHRWIFEFSKYCESITVICLEKGSYELSQNTKVLSLGKEEGVSRLKYLSRFYSYIWKERKNYEAVFVHMNPIYVILGGMIWRMLGKKISLWYTHKNVDWKLRLAEKLTHQIFTASKESFRLSSKKLEVVGHGIDYDFFFPQNSNVVPKSLLSVGRLMPVKRHDLAIRAAALTGWKLSIAGDGPERENLKMLAQKLGTTVEFLDSLTQTQLRDEYRKASFLIHTSETGSLDKVILEALACGLKVISTSSLSDLPIVKVFPTPEAIAEAIVHDHSPVMISSIHTHHSLKDLIPKLLKSIKKL